MDTVAEARNILKSPVLDEKLAQLQHTLSGSTEQYPDVMPPYFTYDYAAIDLPSDVIQAALAQLAAVASGQQALSPLEQLGYYLLKLKAEAEYVAPPPEELPNVTTRATALVEAHHFSAVSPEAFVETMKVVLLPSVHSTAHKLVSGIKVLDVTALNAARRGGVGTLDTLTVELKLTLEVAAPATVDVRSLLDECRAVLKSSTEALPPKGFPLLDVELV